MLEGRRGIGQTAQPLEDEPEPTVPLSAVRLQTGRLAPRAGRLAVASEPPQRETQAAVEPRDTGPLANRFAVARRRQAPAARAPERVGQVDEGAEPRRLDLVRFSKGVGRLLETVLSEETHAETVVRYRVARRARDGLAKRGLG